MLFLDTGFLQDEEIILKLERTADEDPEKGWLPAYYFAICDRQGDKMGVCDLRVGHNRNIYYGGNIGYRVYEPYRGHHYAGKACRLLFELARRHGMDGLIITCNPDNLASRKTCEYAGLRLAEIVELPEDNDMRIQSGETEKCIYRIDFTADEKEETNAERTARRAEKPGYGIAPPDMEAYLAAKSRWDSVAKPLGGLGELEEAVQKIAAAQRTADVDLSRRCIVILCADNGVTAEGVTQSDSSVTALCAEAMANGTSSINQLANAYRAEVLVVDAGMAKDVKNENILRRKIARGTADLACGPAMTRAEAERSVQLGIDIMGGLKQRGVKIAAAGEMGIGNTTTAAAVASVLLGLPPRRVTGRGAGLDSAGLERKISVIEKAIRLSEPSADDPVDIISKVGGFDIGAMAGMFLGGGIYEIPVIIDGMISAAAALLAYRLSPLSKAYMLASHQSGEPAGRLLLAAIGLKPVIDAGMHLGEGTGAAMLLPLLDGALAVYRDAHRFDEIGLERYVKLI